MSVTIKTAREIELMRHAGKLLLLVGKRKHQRIDNNRKNNNGQSHIGNAGGIQKIKNTVDNPAKNRRELA